MYTSCKISVLKDSSYIVVKHTGCINKNIGAAYTIEANKIAMKHKILKFVVDLTEAKNRDTFIEKYQFAYNLQNLPNVIKKAVVAMVVSPKDHSHDFIEKIARKIGFNVTIFRDMQQATEYLQRFDSNGNLKPKDLETELDFLSEEGIQYFCPLCRNKDFIYNHDNRERPIVCKECRLSFDEHEISYFNRDNISAALKDFADIHLEELPAYENNDEFKVF